MIYLVLLIGDRDCHQLGHCPNAPNSCGWAGLKAGAPGAPAKNSTTWVIPAATQGVTGRLGGCT